MFFSCHWSEYSHVYIVVYVWNMIEKREVYPPSTKYCECVNFDPLSEMLRRTGKGSRGAGRAEKDKIEYLAHSP